jgi:hypothetical protein
MNSTVEGSLWKCVESLKRYNPMMQNPTSRIQNLCPGYYNYNRKSAGYTDREMVNLKYKLAIWNRYHGKATYSVHAFKQTRTFLPL